MLEQLNRRIPELEAIVLLKTKLSLFELGNEISAKFFDNKICSVIMKNGYLTENAKAYMSILQG